jgi:hypothetical protein
VRTQSGNIEVTLPPATPVTLDATSGSGAIDVDRDLSRAAWRKAERTERSMAAGWRELTTKAGIRVK